MSFLAKLLKKGNKNFDGNPNGGKAKETQRSERGVDGRGEEQSASMFQHGQGQEQRQGQGRTGDGGGSNGKTRASWDGQQQIYSCLLDTSENTNSPRASMDFMAGSSPSGVNLLALMAQTGPKGTWAQNLTPPSQSAAVSAQQSATALAQQASLHHAEQLSRCLASKQSISKPSRLSVDTDIRPTIQPGTESTSPGSSQQQQQQQRLPPHPEQIMSPTTPQPQAQHSTTGSRGNRSFEQQSRFHAPGQPGMSATGSGGGVGDHYFMTSSVHCSNAQPMLLPNSTNSTTNINNNTLHDIEEERSDNSALYTLPVRGGASGSLRTRPLPPLPTSSLGGEGALGPQFQPPEVKHAELGRMIDKGGHCVIYQGQWEGKDVAVKVMTAEAPETAQTALEVGIAMMLRHPNIVETFGAYHAPAPEAAGASRAHRFLSGSLPSAAESSWQHASCPPFNPGAKQGVHGIQGIFWQAATRRIPALSASSIAVPPPLPPLVQHVIMEHFQEGSLRSLLGRPEAQAMSDMKQVLPLCWDLCCAVEYMHKKNLLHGDIKAANVLIKTLPKGVAAATGRMYSAHLADFGQSMYIIPEGSQPDPSLRETMPWLLRSLATTGDGAVSTPTHLAPEVFHDLTKKALSTDIYALGCTLWEALTRLKPYHKMSHAELMQSKMRVAASRVLLFPPDANPRLVELCHLCWSPLEMRPSASVVRMRLERIMYLLSIPYGVQQL